MEGTPISMGSIALDPYTKEKEVCPVASLIVVLLAHKMPGSSSSQVPFTLFIFFLMSFRISLYTDSTLPLVCGLDTELNQI